MRLINFIHEIISNHIFRQNTAPYTQDELDSETSDTRLYFWFYELVFRFYQKYKRSII